jgi:hypothetical protein
MDRGLRGISAGVEFGILGLYIKNLDLGLSPN